MHCTVAAVVLDNPPLKLGPPPQEDKALRLHSAQGLRALASDEAGRARVAEARGVRAVAGLLPAEGDEEVQAELVGFLQALATAGPQHRARIVECHGCVRLRARAGLRVEISCALAVASARALSMRMCARA
jgi:hypothetical protein